jgi:hypothetical protein
VVQSLLARPEQARDVRVFNNLGCASMWLFGERDVDVWSRAIAYFSRALEIEARAAAASGEFDRISHNRTIAINLQETAQQDVDAYMQALTLKRS